MVPASMLAMNDLSVPASKVCDDASCAVVADVAALKADCITSTKWSSFDAFPNVSFTSCSSFNKDLCLRQAVHPSADDSYNFTSGASAECETPYEPSSMDDYVGYPFEDLETCPVGDFATIYGGWVSSKHADFFMGSTTGHTACIVDCKVQYGTATVSQNGSGAPTLEKHSFTKADSAFLSQRGSYTGLRTDWLSLYRASADDAYAKVSPFKFASRGFSNATLSPLTAYLLFPDEARDSNQRFSSTVFTNDTLRVARDLERAFDVATLLAFARVPGAASQQVTRTKRIQRWTYDERVLTILVIPMVATALVVCEHWRIHGNNVVIGYNPLEIARRADELLPSSAYAKVQDSKSSEYTSSTSRGAYAPLAIQQPPQEMVMESSDMRVLNTPVNEGSSFIRSSRNEQGDAWKPLSTTEAVCSGATGQICRRSSSDW